MRTMTTSLILLLTCGVPAFGQSVRWAKEVQTSSGVQSGGLVVSAREEKRGDFLVDVEGPDDGAALDIRAVQAFNGKRTLRIDISLWGTAKSQRNAYYGFRFSGNDDVHWDFIFIPATNEYYKIEFDGDEIVKEYTLSNRRGTDQALLGWTRLQGVKAQGTRVILHIDKRKHFKRSVGKKLHCQFFTGFYQKDPEQDGEDADETPEIVLGFRNVPTRKAKEVETASGFHKGGVIVSTREEGQDDHQEGGAAADIRSVQAFSGEERLRIDLALYGTVNRRKRVCYGLQVLAPNGKEFWYVYFPETRELDEIIFKNGRVLRAKTLEQDENGDYAELGYSKLGGVRANDTRVLIYIDKEKHLQDFDLGDKIKIRVRAVTCAYRSLERIKTVEDLEDELWIADETMQVDLTFRN